MDKKIMTQFHAPIAQVIEHPLREREFVGTKPSRTIPNENGTSGYLAWCSALNGKNFS